MFSPELMKFLVSYGSNEQKNIEVVQTPEKKEITAFSLSRFVTVPVNLEKKFAL